MRLHARARVSTLLDLSGLTRAIFWYRKLRRVPWLTVVNFHRVNQEEEAAPFDEGVLDATPRSFHEQLSILKRHFTLITLDELRAYRRGGPLPASPALVTFDDGYRDCHEIALPILKTLGIPAAFFIATSYITERRLFWWDRIAYVLKRTRMARLTLSYPARLDLEVEGAVGTATNRLLRIVKSQQGLDVERFLDEITEAADVPWDPAIEKDLADRLLMTWDQIRSLRREGMEIGSHTRTHRPLQTLPAEHLEAELGGSRQDLERELGESVPAIAYPVGEPVAHIPAVRKAIEDAGYELGFSYNTGVQRLDAFDPLSICRFSTERSYGPARFRGLLAVPSLG